MTMAPPAAPVGRRNSRRPDIAFEGVLPLTYARPISLLELRDTLFVLAEGIRHTLGDRSLADRLAVAVTVLGIEGHPMYAAGQPSVAELLGAARAAKGWLLPMLAPEQRAAFSLPTVAESSGAPPGWAQAALAAVERAELALGDKAREPLRARMHGLYVIIDPQATNRHDPLDIAEAALEGGARMLQLRDKARDKGDSLPLARNLVELCRRYDAVSIINDHVDLAVASRADGVHVGQHDLPILDARRVLSPFQAVGNSNATFEEGVASAKAGPDYVAVGDIYGSSSKSNTRPAGLETLQRVRAAVTAPIVAIGGINASNVAAVVQAGADAVCVISAVAGAADPRAAARELVAKIKLAGGKP